LSASEISQKNKKLYRRLKHIIDEAQWKIINYLTTQYDAIYIGKINMQSIVMQDDISEKTKRIGLMLRHYEFRQRLKFKCEERRVRYIEVNERFTSKTCSVCGWYKEDLGGEEKYKCEKCGTIMGRDVSASRCMLFKNTKEKEKAM
jgi:putative transposase